MNVSTRYVSESRLRDGAGIVKAGRASRTAEHNALLRALEALRSSGSAPFDEPMVRAFLTWPLAQVADLARIGLLHRLVVAFIDKRWPGVRSSVVARTSWIDQTITDVLDQSMEQVVILGTGYDTRAYRLEALAGRTVFEVDHPDTQAQKRMALGRAGIEPVSDLRFVATDFNLGNLEIAIASAGYQRSLPTLFLWEGVTNYLNDTAVDATLRWCARASEGSHLIFTYIHRDVLTAPGNYAGARRVFSTLRRANETMTFGIDPAELPGYLAERQLTLVQDLGARTYRQHYYGDAASTIRGHEFYRIAHAATNPRQQPQLRPERHSGGVK